MSAHSTNSLNALRAAPLKQTPSLQTYLARSRGNSDDYIRSMIESLMAWKADYREWAKQAGPIPREVVNRRLVWRGYLVKLRKALECADGHHISRGLCAATNRQLIDKGMAIWRCGHRFPLAETGADGRTRYVVHGECPRWTFVISSERYLMIDVSEREVRELRTKWIDRVPPLLDVGPSDDERDEFFRARQRAIVDAVEFLGTPPGRVLGPEHETLGGFSLHQVSAAIRMGTRDFLPP